MADGLANGPKRRRGCLWIRTDYVLGDVTIDIPLTVQSHNLPHFELRQSRGRHPEPKTLRICWDSVCVHADTVDISKKQALPVIKFFTSGKTWHSLTW